MGPPESKIESPDLPQEKEKQSPADMNQLPDEVLELILSFVPGRSLVAHCGLVCHRWHDLIGRPTFWKLQCERDPAHEATLQAARRYPWLDWCRACVLHPFGRNLIKNPCGAELFQHWNVHHGGMGWRVEKSQDCLEGTEIQTCFLSSFCLCIKTQLIDLLKEGFEEDLLDFYQPDIFISDWWGSRPDYFCIYRLQVSLLASDMVSVLADFKAEPPLPPEWSNDKYQQVSHVFRNYGPGVRYVRFWHEAKDVRFWADVCGIRITNSSVVVKFSEKTL